MVQTHFLRENVKKYPVDSSKKLFYSHLLIDFIRCVIYVLFRICMWTKIRVSRSIPKPELFIEIRRCLYHRQSVHVWKHKFYALFSKTESEIASQKFFGGFFFLILPMSLGFLGKSKVKRKSKMIWILFKVNPPLVAPFPCPFPIPQVWPFSNKKNKKKQISKKMYPKFSSYFEP